MVARSGCANRDHLAVNFGIAGCKVALAACLLTPLIGKAPANHFTRLVLRREGNTGAENIGQGNTGAKNAGQGNTGAENHGAGNTGYANNGSGNTGANNNGSGNTGSGLNGEGLSN